MIKLSLFLISISLLTACGNKDDSPLALKAYNQKCLEGKIRGQFLVKYSNGTHEIVPASSAGDFFNKILSPEKIELLNKKNISISGVDHNFRVRIKSTPPPPPNSTPTSDPNAGPRMLNAPYLWEQGFYGQNVVTALIDSGYDTSHVLLKDSVSINSLEHGLDEDNNQLINDVLGWDFVNNTPLTGDLGFHGTIVGSIIAADHAGSIKFSMAPGSKIVPITALEADGEGITSASGDSNSVLSSIDYAMARDVDFINASWAGDICSKFIRQKIKAATDANIIFVTSAGNESTDLDEKPIFPGSFPFSLIATVGAVNLDSSRQEDSNYGHVVDFFSLGSNVAAAAPHSFLTTASGTSVAAPFITGGLALLKSAFPTASPATLLNALEKSKNNKKIPDLKRAFLELKSQ
ncbi:MAG: S8 family serine peptidase [Bdellovibrionales bacterium]